MLLTDLSRSQRHLLIRVRDTADGLIVENRSTCAASLVRKGFATKVLTKRKPSTDIPCLRGRLAEVRITDAGREWLSKFEP